MNNNAEIKSCPLGSLYLEPDNPLSASRDGQDAFIKALKDFLEEMEEEWYLPRALFDYRSLWNRASVENPERYSLGYPPYSFSFEKKYAIEASLRIVQRYGSMLLKNLSSIDEKSMVQKGKIPAGKTFYDCLKESISSVIWKGLRVRTQLDTGNFPVLLSPVHGDLNGNNILYIISQYPQLIDLSEFQWEGHTLQDYARLETEVKFKFMDCGQVQGKHFNKDLCPALFNSWKEVENILCQVKAYWSENEFRGEKAISDAENTSASRCALRALKCIGIIRQHAINFQMKPQIKFRDEQSEIIEENKKSFFLIGYYVALLYQTIRSISFESLPMTKRIFAVYSAARIIDLLNNFDYRV